MFAPEYIGTLHVIAQIAITLIGFTGIVVALRHKPDQAWDPRVNAQLYALVVLPGMVMAFCFLPGVLFASGMAEPDIWLWSNGLFGCAKLLAIGYFTVLAFKQDNYEMGQVFLQATGLLIAVLHFLVVFSIINAAELIYIIGLLWPLFVGTVNFMKLIGLRFRD